MIDKLHYISQATENSSHLNTIEQVLLAGGKWIQLRVKNQPMDQVFELAIGAAKLCREHGATLIVNDFPEIAKSSGAHGVHLGLDDMPILQARKLLGNDMVIGGTANTFAHVLQRIEEGADYIGLGPYRFTSTKQNLSPIIGLKGYQDIIKQVQEHKIKIPIIAIGGITLSDIPSLLQTGVYGVAISGALSNQTDTTAILQKINQSLVN